MVLKDFSTENCPKIEPFEYTKFYPTEKPYLFEKIQAEISEWLAAEEDRKIIETMAKYNLSGLKKLKILVDKTIEKKESDGPTL